MKRILLLLLAISGGLFDSKIDAGQYRNKIAMHAVLLKMQDGSTVEVKKVPRAECSVCKGTGKVSAGDGTTRVVRECDNCYVPINLQSYGEQALDWISQVKLEVPTDEPKPHPKPITKTPPKTVTINGTERNLKQYLNDWYLEGYSIPITDNSPCPECDLEVGLEKLGLDVKHLAELDFDTKFKLYTAMYHKTRSVKRAIYFGTEWCGSCLMMNAVEGPFKLLKEDGYKIGPEDNNHIVKYDGDKDKDAARRYKPEKFPCWILTFDDFEIARDHGYKTKEQVIQFFNGGRKDARYFRNWCKTNNVGPAYTEGMTTYQHLVDPASEAHHYGGPFQPWQLQGLTEVELKEIHGAQHVNKLTPFGGRDDLLRRSAGSERTPPKDEEPAAPVGA